MKALTRLGLSITVIAIAAALAGLGRYDVALVLLVGMIVITFTSLLKRD